MQYSLAKYKLLAIIGFMLIVRLLRLLYACSTDTVFVVVAKLFFALHIVIGMQYALNHNSHILLGQHSAY